MTDYVKIKSDIMANYEKRGRIIGEKSVDKYLNDIKKIQGLLGDLGQVDDLSFLYNVKDVMGVIEDMKGRKVVAGEKVPASSNTKRNYFQSIVSVMDALQDYKAVAYYQKIVNNYNKEYKKNNELASMSLTPENQEKLISYDELTQIVQKQFLDVRPIFSNIKNLEYILTQDDMMEMQTYILLKLYSTYIARNEFATLHWLTLSAYNKMTEDGDTLKDEYNYIVMNHHHKALRKNGDYPNKDGKLILNDYKTAGLYNTREIKLSVEINNLFARWKAILNRFSKQSGISFRTQGNPVFFQRFFDILDELWVEAGMTSNGLSKHFSRYFEKKIGKPLGTTSIAKIVNSHQNKVAVDSLKENSNNRGTSIGTLSQVYSPVLPS